MREAGESPLALAEGEKAIVLQWMFRQQDLANGIALRSEEKKLSVRLLSLPRNRSVVGIRSRLESCPRLFQLLVFQVLALQGVGEARFQALDSLTACLASSFNDPRWSRTSRDPMGK